MAPRVRDQSDATAGEVDRYEKVLKALKQFFDEQLKQESDSAPDEHALQIAAAALLFETSRTEAGIGRAERDTINRLVKRQFNLSADEADRLLDLAEQEVDQATSLHGFVSLINDNWSQGQRIQLVEFMWRVAYSDQSLNDHEVHLMRKIQRLLYIPHKKFIGAKLRARDGESKK